MNAHWYDVLDVDPTSSTEEIGTAWRDAIADLTPADRRFRLYNQAAEVLLDPEQRAAYDADLAREAADVAEAKPMGPPREDSDSDQAEPALLLDAEPGAVRLVPVWLLIVVGWLAVGCVVATAVAWSKPHDTFDGSAARFIPGESVEEATGSARAAAERAVVPVLSYDYRTLDEDEAAAQELLTSGYRTDYDDLFEVIRDNAGELETVVEVEVIASAVVRAGEDRVEVLLFVNRPTTNAEVEEPVTYKDQVTLTMQQVDGDWLVDDIKTSPVQQ